MIAYMVYFWCCTIVDVVVGVSGCTYRNAPLFLHGANMINAAVILEAEKDLYNSVLNRDFSRDIKADIQQITSVYVLDEEIKNIMQVYGLTENDFQIIYYHIFDSYEFHELLFVRDEPCLFATALLLDLNGIIAIANRIKTDKNKRLTETVNSISQIFFHEHAVKQHIVSVQHFCRNGICDKLKK